jgi:UDP-N-acetylmuramate dehydrogenase
MPAVRGKLTADAALAPLLWFKAGGRAEWLFEPADADDLADFLAALDPDIPVWPLGAGSNLIVRDGGLKGVAIRLGRPFAEVVVDGDIVRAGAGAPDMAVANRARDAGLSHLEFLRGIPGTVGGAVRMNAGAYGRETVEVLRSADVVTRNGERKTLKVGDLDYAYRHSNLAPDTIVVGAEFVGEPGDKVAIAAEMDRIVAAREASQPTKSRTGGSTFKNPEGHKAWQLIDAAGCRGLTVGGAQVSEKHCNFLINLGTATASDIEALGEEVRARVEAQSGVTLEWEIKRVGKSL